MKLESWICAAALMMATSAPAHEGEHNSRVIVSTTLNDTLLFFDAETLDELQPPVPSKGGGPVRLWLQEVGGKPYLFAANHGLALGSVGVFDVSGEIASELPLSPFPARAGSVGIAGAELSAGDATAPMIFVTNTWFALGPCEMPAGSVTGYDASLLASAGLLQEIGTVELTGAVPFAVSVDGGSGVAFASVNCADTLETIAVSRDESVPGELPLAARFRLDRAATRETGDGPDGTIVDAARDRVYTVNIGGGSISVHDGQSPDVLTTVPLGGGAHPIEATLAESPGGASWVITANGSGNSVSIVDRNAIETCIGNGDASCAGAEVLRVGTKPGGEPEGIAYDPATNRIFAVNKYPIGSPSLSVIQLIEDPAPSGAEIDVMPLGGLGSSGAIPALIAFDVAVQVR